MSYILTFRPPLISPTETPSTPAKERSVEIETETKTIKKKHADGSLTRTKTERVRIRQPVENAQDISQFLRLSPLAHRLDQRTMKRSSYPRPPTTELPTTPAKQKSGRRNPTEFPSTLNPVTSAPAVTSYGPEIPRPSTFRAPLHSVNGFYVIEVGQEVGIFYDWQVLVRLTISFN